MQRKCVKDPIDTAALMLRSDKSRGYCLEMICADFLAGAHLDNGDAKVLLSSMWHLFKFLPDEYRQAFLEQITNELPDEPHFRKAQTLQA